MFVRLTAFWTAPHSPKPSMSLSDQRGVVEFSVHQLRRLSLVVLCNAHEVDHDVPGGGGLLEGDHDGDDDAWKRKTARPDL